MTDLEFGSEEWLEDVMRDAHTYESDLPLYDAALRFKRQRDEARERLEAVKALKVGDVARHIEQTIPLWLQHAIAMLHDMVDQTNPSDPIGAALTRVGLERRVEPDEPLPMSDARATLMWCVLRSKSVSALPSGDAAEGSGFKPGDLVCVEVPPNCTIHSSDAQRLGRIMHIAEKLGDMHATDSVAMPAVDDVARALLDELTQLTSVSARRNADGSEDVKVRR